MTEVTAKTLYLTTSTGALVKVRLTKATTYTRTARSPKGGLALGDTAIVIGSKNASGVLVATSVIATQKGVTATRGGFGGGGLRRRRDGRRLNLLQKLSHSLTWVIAVIPHTA